MKPFKLTPYQARRSKKDIETKDRIVAEYTKRLNDVLRDGVEQVYASYLKTGKYKAPKLDGLQAIFEGFYRATLTAAVDSARAQKPGKKKLASLPSGDLPDGAKPLEDALKRNKGYFQSVMKRATALKEKALKSYLLKLKNQFKKVLPLLESTEISPREIKKQIAEAWRTSSVNKNNDLVVTPSKARVETIFRTEATKYFAKTQVAYFEDSDEIIGFLFDSVRDTARTPICKSRHGLIFRPGTPLLAKNTPPCHYNCRSHLIPLVNDDENQKMLQDPQRTPDESKMIPLPPGWITK